MNKELSEIVKKWLNNVVIARLNSNETEVMLPEEIEADPIAAIKENILVYNMLPIEFQKKDDVFYAALELIAEGKENISKLPLYDIWKAGGPLEKRTKIFNRIRRFVC